MLLAKILAPEESWAKAVESIDRSGSILQRQNVNFNPINRSKVIEDRIYPVTFT